MLSFPRIPDPSLTYTVEGTGNLADWDDIWTSPGAPELAGPVTVADLETTLTQARRMLRLKVVRD